MGPLLVALISALLGWLFPISCNAAEAPPVQLASRYVYDSQQLTSSARCPIAERELCWTNAPPQATAVVGSCVAANNGSLWGVPGRAGVGLCPLGSLGQVWDEDTGWVSNVRRYDDPVLGGFVSPDPIGVEGGVNPHAGAPNPLTWADPLGLTWCFKSALNSDAKQAGINAPYKLDNTAAKSADEVVKGIAESRTYIDLTKGGSIRNVGTNATHTEFADTLTAGRRISRTSRDGAVQIFQRDGAKYVLRERAGSYGGWTADFTPAGAQDVTLKIRLGYTP
ncbi:RHS repeat-associated core domain-containing protein [Austwickia chelonae]|nr:RHS repeat-associated core domain-containing protein [Austwickia chelonae]